MCKHKHEYIVLIKKVIFKIYTKLEIASNCFYIYLHIYIY